MSQDELPFGPLASSKLFPGRTVLLVKEVAEALRIHVKQVADLICAGDLDAINISRSQRRASEMTAEERLAVRRVHWRIPVSAYDKFLKARRNS